MKNFSAHKIRKTNNDNLKPIISPEGEDYRARVTQQLDAIMESITTSQLYKLQTAK